VSRTREPICGFAGTMKLSLQRNSRLPCRRSRVRAPSAASRKPRKSRGFLDGIARAWSRRLSDLVRADNYTVKAPAQANAYRLSSSSFRRSRVLSNSPQRFMAASAPSPEQPRDTCCCFYWSSAPSRSQSAGRPSEGRGPLVRGRGSASAESLQPSHAA